MKDPASFFFSKSFKFCRCSSAGRRRQKDCLDTPLGFSGSVSWTTPSSSLTASEPLLTHRVNCRNLQKEFGTDQL